MVGRAQFDCKEKLLAWARDRFMNGLSDRKWKSKFTKYLLDTQSCKFRLQSASNEDGPTMEEFCRVFDISFPRGASQESRPVLAGKLCAMIEASLKRQPRLEPSASIVGAESIPQPVLDNVLHDGRDSGQQARQRNECSRRHPSGCERTPSTYRRNVHNRVHRRTCQWIPRPWHRRLILLS